MAWVSHVQLFGPARQFPFEASSPYTADDALPEDYLRVQAALGLRRAGYACSQGLPDTNGASCPASNLASPLQRMMRAGMCR